MKKLLIAVSMFFAMTSVSVAQVEHSVDTSQYEKATFAGGCFWCMQPPFDKLPGVKSTLVGYTGGPEKSPTYYQVAQGKTGHAEAIEVIYDPKEVTYEQLLTTFWHQINPTQLNRQFADKGTQYRTAIYYHNADQQRKATKSKIDLTASGKFSQPIVVEVTPASEFFVAEAKHQKYYKKNPQHYNQYKKYSGREGYIKRVWGVE